MAVQLTQNFQERIFERIRESIGELLSDDDLKKIVEASIQKSFFEPRVLSVEYGREKLGPSFLQEEISKLFEAKVREEIKAWLAAHPDEVTKVINETIEKGITGMMASYFESRTYGPLQQLAYDLKNKGIL